MPRNLAVGEPVPDFFIPHIINGRRPSASIADFKNQLLIIDFWSVHCSGCVAGLPAMESLQNAFGDKIKVLPVTFESRQEVSVFLKKNLHTAKLNVETVVDDKSFSKWFRHKFIPHEVWIYRDTVIAMTDEDYVSADNIKLVLSGKKNDWPVKNDMLAEFDPNLPFLQIDSNQYNWKNGPLRYSALMGYRSMTGVIKKNFSYAIDTIRHTVRHYFVNMNVISAYEHYWEIVRHPERVPMQGIISNDRIIYDVRDSSHLAFRPKLKDETMEEWHRRYQFCFESVAGYHGQSAVEQAKTVIADLDHVLNVHGRWEKRKVNCLVIVQKGTNDEVEQVRRTASKGAYFELEGRYHPAAQPKADDLEHSGREFSAKRLPWAYENLMHGNKRPLVIQSNYTGTFILPAHSFDDVASLRRGLQTCGFDLVEGERETDMFVFSDK